VKVLKPEQNQNTLAEKKPTPIAEPVIVEATPRTEADKTDKPKRRSPVIEAEAVAKLRPKAEPVVARKSGKVSSKRSQKAITAIGAAQDV